MHQNQDGASREAYAYACERLYRYRPLALKIDKPIKKS
jgi:hypothetical protein